MKITEDILEKYEGTSDGWTTTFTYEECCLMIDEAKKDVIQECINRTYISDDNFNPSITKKELEGLLKEISTENQ